MSVSASLPTMSDEFRASCKQLGVTDDMLEFALKRGDLAPTELLLIDTTTSSRNFRVAYLNKAGERKWTHLFLVPNPADV